jgi:hypothetical protein
MGFKSKIILVDRSDRLKYCQITLFDGWWYVDAAMAHPPDAGAGSTAWTEIGLALIPDKSGDKPWLVMPGFQPVSAVFDTRFNAVILRSDSHRSFAKGAVVSGRVLDLSLDGPAGIAVDKVEDELRRQSWKNRPTKDRHYTRDDDPIY